MRADAIGALLRAHRGSVNLEVVDAMAVLKVGLGRRFAQRPVAAHPLPLDDHPGSQRTPIR